jgi:hypothetical protein
MMIVVRANITMVLILMFSGLALGDPQHAPSDDRLLSPIRPLRVDKIPGPKHPPRTISPYGEPFRVEDPPSSDGEVFCDDESAPAPRKRCGLW